MLTGADRVTKARELLGTGDTYPKGCSDFVCAVLGIPWESANSLIGANAPFVGANGVYSGLAPGDLVGWIEDGGSGHVGFYVQHDGRRFIDVRGTGEAPRELSSYGPAKLYKSARY